ncbi:MAG: hypothetical protein Ct9H90mP30_3630 [Actinomycetota bacterium]|nr:MAG: hypothetical protein Ct9H90mP30_3630 [Actinomycetota bacterium]
MATVGIIASPSAGKDVRRLVGHAGSTGDVDKIAVIRRAALGVIESNVDRLLYLDDTRHLIQRALEGIPHGNVQVEPINQAVMGTGRDSEKAAKALKEEGGGSRHCFRWRWNPTETLQKAGLTSHCYHSP